MTDFFAPGVTDSTPDSASDEAHTLGTNPDGTPHVHYGLYWHNRTTGEKRLAAGGLAIFENREEAEDAQAAANDPVTGVQAKLREDRDNGVKGIENVKDIDDDVVYVVEETSDPLPSLATQIAAQTGMPVELAEALAEALSGIAGEGGFEIGGIFKLGDDDETDTDAEETGTDK